MLEWLYEWMNDGLNEWTNDLENKVDWDIFANFGVREALKSNDKHNNEELQMEERGVRHAEVEEPEKNILED